MKPELTKEFLTRLKGKVPAWAEEGKRRIAEGLELAHNHWKKLKEDAARNNQESDHSTDVSSNINPNL